MSLLMETLMYFGGNPEATEIREYLTKILSVNELAESLHIRADLKGGDITCYIMYPSENKP